MMRTFVSLLILFISNFSWATATPEQIKKAQDVLKTAILPQHYVRMSPEKLKAYINDVTYEALRPGDILRMAVDIKNIPTRTGKSYLDNQHEGFSESKDSSTELLKGDFLRVLRKTSSNDVDFASKDNFKGVDGSYIEVVDYVVVKLNKNFEPVGSSFNLTARGGLSRKITDFERIEGGFLSRNPPLSFSRAGVNDLLVSTDSVDTGRGIIPAFSPAIIVKTVRTRIPWTISNYNYVFTLHLLNCPEAFKAQKCEVQIKGTKMYADPDWSHYTMPENRREIKILGGTLMY